MGNGRSEAEGIANCHHRALVIPMPPDMILERNRVSDEKYGVLCQVFARNPVSEIGAKFQPTGIDINLPRSAAYC
jgi:hypothetical protein